MKRIRIWADTHSTGLIDEFGAPVRREQTTISDETWDQLQMWVADYDHIIPLSEAERGALSARIGEFDERGLYLLACVRSEWPTDVATGTMITFEYYSEGLMRTIDA